MCRRIPHHDHTASIMRELIFPNALPLLNDLLDDGKAGIVEKVFVIEANLSVDSLLTCPGLSYVPITDASLRPDV